MSKTKETVLLYAAGQDAREWKVQLSTVDVPVAIWPDDFSGHDGGSAGFSGGATLDSVTFSICWKPPGGLLARCPQLRGVQALGAGVDAMLSPDVVPESVPIARIVDPCMTQRMATWIVWAVINSQRQMDAMHAAQLRCEWRPELVARAVDNKDARVAILGAGVMGSAAAAALTALGYQVVVWGREGQRRGPPGVTRIHGEAALRAVLPTTHLLVCLLPLTPALLGVLNGRLFAHLPRGAALVHAGRGAHLVETDLLSALRSGRIGHAVLDVFETEPLPSDSPLWREPNVRITPHVAASTSIAGSVSQVADNYRRAIEGAQMLNAVDRSAGY